MAFIIDDILFSPLKFTIWLGQKLREAAYQEMTDESKIHEGLLQLQMRHEMGEISEEAYEKEETMLMERLEAIREMKEANENEFKYGGRGRKGSGGTQ